MQDYYDHTVYKDGVRDLDYQFMAVIFKIEMLIVWFHEKIKSYIVLLCLKTKILTSLYFFTYLYIFLSCESQWYRKFKKVQAKEKLVKSNESISRIFFFFYIFPILK